MFGSFYVPYRIVNYAFGLIMIFSKVVAPEPTKDTKLTRPISNRWCQWKVLTMNKIVNCVFDSVMIFSEVVISDRWSH